jgi:hypothetical protein
MTASILLHIILLHAHLISVCIVNEWSVCMRTWWTHPNKMYDVTLPPTSLILWRARVQRKSRETGMVSLGSYGAVARTQQSEILKYVSPHPLPQETCV